MITTKQEKHKPDPQLTATETAAIEAATAFSRDVIAPNAREWELARAMPREVMTQAAGAGLCRLLVPEGMGGSELSLRAMSKVMEALSYGDFAAAFALVVHNNFCRSLAANGSPELLERYLASSCAAETIGSFLLTEPQSGSDAANLKTVAVRDGDDWVINGEKAWVTNSDKADILAVYLQTDPAAGWRGIACVLVDRETPGVELVGPYDLMGGHAMAAGGFTFKNVRVPQSQTMIPVGEGFKAAMGGIDVARVVVGAMCSGMLKCALDVAYPYALKREAFGQSIADFQGIQWQLADVATDLHAIDLMVAHAAGAIDAGENVPLPAAHAKKFATRVAQHGLSQCMQVMGADGYKHEFPLARHLACVKAGHYMDGTTEIQNVVISRGMRKSYELG